MRAIFQFTSLLFVLISMSCGPKKVDFGEVFPTDDVLVPIDSVGQLVFRWDSDPDEISTSDQRFKLYRLDSYTNLTDERNHSYSLVMDEPVRSGNSLSLKNRDLSQITSGRHYIWRVSSIEKATKCLRTVAVHSFAVVNSISKSAFAMRDVYVPSPIDYGWKCDTSFIYPGCINTNIRCRQVGGPIIHIVNLEDVDFLSNNFEVRSLEAENSPSGGCLSGVLDSFSFYTRFVIEVPCHKKRQLNTDTIQLYLFSGPNNEQLINLDYEVILNEDSSEVKLAPITIQPNDYNESNCSGYCKVNCKAIVDISGKAPLLKDPDGAPYPHNLVFFLENSSDHLSEELGDHDNSDVSSSCGFDPMLFSYFKCIDGFLDHNGVPIHESQHVVIVPIEICD